MEPHPGRVDPTVCTDFIFRVAPDNTSFDIAPIGRKLITIDRLGHYWLYTGSEIGCIEAIRYHVN